MLGFIPREYIYVYGPVMRTPTRSRFEARRDAVAALGRGDKDPHGVPED